MEQRIAANDVQKMLRSVCNVIVKNEAYLTQIDNQSGDGDHGIGMKRGFSQLGETLGKNTFATINDLFYQSGLTLIKTMGGASGVLFGTLFTGGLKEMPVLQSLDLRQFADMLYQSLRAIMRRGQTQPGDKTMVDALAPAVCALRDGAKKELDFPLALQKAALAAKEGCEKTATMIAKKGRSRQYGEKSIGFRDAGAVSISLIFEEMASWAHEHLNAFKCVQKIHTDGEEKQ